jgi:hypothetical protein
MVTSASMRTGRVVKVAVVVASVALLIGYLATRANHASAETRVRTAFRAAGLSLSATGDGRTTVFLRPHAARDPLSLQVIVFTTKLSPQVKNQAGTNGLRVIWTKNIRIEFDPNAARASDVLDAVAHLG